MITAVQQFAVRKTLCNEKQARETLNSAEECGYEGIEMCGFLTRKIPLLIRGFAAMAGMSIGPCCKLDWKKLIAESKLKVVSVHEDLGTINDRTDMVVAEAESFGTRNIVITGMFK